MQTRKQGITPTLWVIFTSTAYERVATWTCSITSSHGVVNGATQGFRNNPNGYRPLYVAAETQIHDAARQDRALLTAGEQSTRAMLARLLGAVGVKKVTVDFG